jgi:hypothetical protein
MESGLPFGVLVQAFDGLGGRGLLGEDAVDWHHMTKSLRFNPPPPLPGTDTRPRAGAPLIAVCLGSVAAPLIFLTATMVERMRVRPGGTPPETTG